VTGDCVGVGVGAKVGFDGAGTGERVILGAAVVSTSPDPDPDPSSPLPGASGVSRRPRSSSGSCCGSCLSH